MKHRHAELMMEYARDAMETEKPWERWEFRFEGDEWKDLVDHAIWRKDCEYRRKSRTVNINGFEVPEPVRSPLEKGTVYCIPMPDHTDLFGLDEWTSSHFDHLLLNKGLIHLSEEAAIKHAEALLSFTRIDK